MAKNKNFKHQNSDSDKPKNGGKPSYKPKGRKPKSDDAPAEGYKKTEGSNAFAWHSPDAELLRRASETTWSYQTGEIMDMDSPIVNDTFGLDTNAAASQAGIFVVRTLPSVGGIGMWNPAMWERNYTLPTYNAANTLLTEMRSRSRIRNTYDAPDVLMLMLAMANIYAGVFLAKRLAGTARAFTYKNQYFPEKLIEVQGFDPEWFKKNQFRFVTELNVIIAEINKIYIPNKMHLFELLQERFSYYYTEGKDVRDQVYVITPAFLSAIDFNATTDYASHIAPVMCIPGSIAAQGVTGGTKWDRTQKYTGDQLLNTLRFMLAQVVNHDSTPDITGDMENCFGTGERFYLPGANPDDIVVPTFDEEILETIHNMSWSKAVVDKFRTYDTTLSAPYWNVHGAFTTFQNPSDNRIGTWDYFEVTNSAANKALFRAESSFGSWLDVHSDPNSEKTFAITRLKNVTSYRTEYNSKLYVQVMFTTDLICDVNYYQFTENASQQMELTNYKVEFVAPESLVNFRIDCNMQAFHYRPVRGMIDATSCVPLSGQWVLGESDIWAKLDYSMFKNMNRISLLSLLGAYNNMQ